MTNRTLTAVIDRIIPADDDPSASQAGVLHYLDQHPLTGISPGLASLDAESQAHYSRSFDTLSSGDQDALLTMHEQDAWFTELVTLTMEGYYADPGNGGNRDEASWRMIGFNPHS